MNKHLKAEETETGNWKLETETDFNKNERRKERVESVERMRMRIVKNKIMQIFII